MNKVLLLFFAVQVIVYSQSIDSTTIKIDSLVNRIDELESKLLLIKENTVKEDDFNQLLEKFETDTALIPEGQRSSNKRLDALLSEINKRPGVIRFNGSAVSVIQNILKNDDGKSSANGLVDLYGTTSFGGQSLFFVYFQAKGGNGLDQNVNALVSTDANAGSTQSSDGADVILIPEAWAEFSFFTDQFKFTVGKLDLTNYFDNNKYANDEYSQFITSGFVNSSALPINNTAPAIRVQTSLLNRFFIQFALSSFSNSGDDIFNDLIKVGSIGFKVFPESNFEGNLKIFGYLHPNADNKLGYGLSFDQTLFDFIGLFVRWNKNHNHYSEVINIKNSFSSGLSYKNTLFNRGFTSGIAYGEHNTFNSNIRPEQFAELFNLLQVNEWVSISTHLQGIWNIQGSNKKTYLAALKAQINF